MDIYLNVPATKEELSKIKVGDRVFLSGTVYSARDAAHKRMSEALASKEDLPFNIKDAAIYYLGPSPARPGQVIGSAGPTTSGRMDKYTPELLDLGLSVMIGKGRRTDAVTEAIRRNGAVYLAAVGGAGALLSKKIVSAEVIAYDDLGTEAIRKMEVREMPLICVTDSKGNVLY